MGNTPSRPAPAPAYDFKVGFWNIQGGVSSDVEKQEKIKTYIPFYDVFAIAETKLGIKSDYPTIDGYTHVLYISDACLTNNCRGFLLYYKTALVVADASILGSYKTIEFMFYSFKVKHKIIKLLFVYRPPDADIPDLVELCKSPLFGHAQQDYFVAMGDFNIDLSDEKFKDFALHADLTQEIPEGTVTRPARHGGEEGSLIDHIWVNDIARINVVEISGVPKVVKSENLSDHHIIRYVTKL